MCTVPPIFSSRSVSSVGDRIASLRPNANSPSVRAPSSVSSAARRNASPLSASASTQRPRLEAQTRALDALPAPGRRHRERHDALGGVLVRAGEDLAVGQVVAAGGADPAPAADAHAQIGALGHDAQLVDVLEPRDQPILPLALGAPGDHGSGWSSLSARASSSR